MAEEAPAPAATAAAAPAPAKTGRVAKAGKKKVSPPRRKDVPSLPKLIESILTESKERKGVSMAAIKKDLGARGVDVPKANKRINVTMAKEVSQGKIIQVKGTGASGSFKLAKMESVKRVKEVKKPPVKVKKPVAKKSPAKKQPVKKAAKKTAAKKPVKKSTPKKTAPKGKPSPKKAAKKPEPKKAAKKVASKQVKKSAVKKPAGKKTKK